MTVVVSLYDSNNKGIAFIIISPSKTWYPASSYRYGYYGGLGIVGEIGHYWSASPCNDSAYYLGFSDYGNVAPSNYYYRLNGYSVRCVRESK